jgi:hypothetical protein
MKKVNSLTALFMSAVFVLGAGIAVTATAQGKPTNSKVAAKPLKAAKDSLDAKRYPDAIVKLKEVQALSGKNAYDALNEMLSYACPHQSVRGSGEGARADARLRVRPALGRAEARAPARAAELSAQELRQGHRAGKSCREGRLRG